MIDCDPTKLLGLGENLTSTQIDKNFQDSVHIFNIENMHGSNLKIIEYILHLLSEARRELHSRVEFQE